MGAALGASWSRIKCVLEGCFNGIVATTEEGLQWVERCLLDSFAFYDRSWIHIENETRLMRQKRNKPSASSSSSAFQNLKNPFIKVLKVEKLSCWSVLCRLGLPAHRHAGVSLGSSIFPIHMLICLLYLILKADGAHFNRSLEL